MQDNPNKMKDLWGTFLDNIQKVCNKKLDLEKNLFSKENKVRILELLDEVLNQLRTKEVKRIFKDKISELQKEPKGEEIVSWLEKEIEIFNSSVDDDFNDGLKDIKHFDNRISQGKTIKDSIDKLFKPRGWLKKIFDVLNELLSLIKGSP